MPRIFASVALTNILLLIATGALGLWARKLGTDRHVLLSVLTLLVSCFVQVLAFTYLTVTGKLIGQAVHLGRLDASILQMVKSYKRTMTRCLASVFVSVVLVTATGAGSWRLGGATVWHDVAVGLVFVVHLGTFWKEYEVIFLNARLMTRVLHEYEKKRRGSSADLKPAAN